VAASARMGWRWLTRMKSALYLLGVLGLLSLLATVVPQAPNVPATVRAWRAGEEGPGTVVSSLIDLVGGYDVYGSPLFLALLLLLFLSLTACLVPRIRAFWRLARYGRPPFSRNLDTQPHTVTFRTSAPPTVALAAARDLLTDRRYRVRGPDEDALDQIAGEKGIVSREGGSLVFHLSFYVLLVAVVLGQLWGFMGQVGIVEREPGFTDTEVAYWNQQPGRWWSPEDHRGFTLTLDQFHIDWIREVRFGGQPTLFLADVTVTEPDGSARTGRIGGNDPMVVDGMKIHLLEWGYAPRIVVEVDGEVVYDAFSTAIATDRGFFRTAVKVPAADPDVGMTVAMYPFAPVDDNGDPTLTGAPWADAPGLVVASFRGDLQLDRAQNVNTLNTEGLDLTGGGFVPLGGRLEFPDGVSISFPELRRWAGFQVSHRPTVPFLLLGSALMLLGLIPALYAYRRRVWIRAVGAEDGGGTLVTLAGRAFQRPQLFEDEHTDLVEQLRQRLPDDEPAVTPDGSALHE
jgi:cytochrome c biogenesis protein